MSQFVLPPNGVTIGLDVGGTKIKGGVLSADGTMAHVTTIPTLPEREGAAVLNDCLHLVTQLQKATIQPLLGIGLGLPELITPQGCITSSHTLDWQEKEITAAFQTIAPVVVTADVRAAAVAEARLGAGQDFDTFVYISIGTGISSCLVQGGIPFAGARGNALVLTTGFMTVLDENEQLLKLPPLETISSGTGIVSRYNKLQGDRVTRAETVLARMAQGDSTAAQVIHSAATALGSALGWLVNVLDPTALLIGGGLGVGSDLYRQLVADATRTHIWAEASQQLPIVPAALGEGAGMIGAALLAQDQG